jgi:CHASE3 domain sensor protein
LPQADILKTLEANWVNGNDLASQKAIAKSLIKLHLSAANATAVAVKASVDPVVLTSVASNLETGTPLSQAQGDAYSRFDLITTALLDEAYQVSEQVYRNWTRTLAAVVAVVLAVAGAWSLEGASFWSVKEITLAVLVGLLATPLAPIAKDLSSALATAVNTMQLVKK